MRIGLWCVLGLWLVPGASAGMLITANQQGGDVVFSAAGTLDFSASSFLATVYPDARLDPDSGLVVGDFGNADVYAPVAFMGPSSIGPGTSPILADLRSGDLLGYSFSTPVNLAVPENYVSGDFIAGQATFTNHSLATLGLDEGQYTWTWDTATGTDFITLTITPEPASALLWGGLVLLSSCGRRSRV